jgi:hypothetical protein
MIYRYTELTDIEVAVFKNSEPFIDYSFDSIRLMNNWTVDRRVNNGVECEKLRLYRFEQLRQGFICNDLAEAKKLALYMNDESNAKDLETEYPWLKEYLNTNRENPHLKTLAIPLQEFIRYYSGDFEKLAMIDFRKAFEIKGVNFF